MQFALEHIEMILTVLYLIYCLIIRRVPTKKDFEIVSILAKMLNRYIPNKKKGGGYHK